MLRDSHFHLDFLDDPAAFLRDSLPLGVEVVAQTVLPSHFARDIDKFSGEWAGAIPSLGFHPWWVDEDYERELDIFAAQLPRTRYVGEIGLDFGPRHVGSRDLQVTVLQRILQLVGDRTLSIHAVRAASAVLDLLEGTDAHPVFHWFSGTSDELTRLIRMGGSISVNPRMLQTKRGRAYIRQVPPDRLLLETDLPGDDPVSAEEHAHILRQLAADVQTLV